MPRDDLTADDLRRQQRAEQDALAQSQTDDEADTHERRADKAGYLREKLEEQEQADRAAAGDHARDQSG
jgi:hypothetical protein